MQERKVMITNQDDDNVFAVVLGADQRPKIQVKQGKGKNAYRDIDVEDAIPKIYEAIDKLA